MKVKDAINCLVKSEKPTLIIDGPDGRMRTPKFNHWWVKYEWKSLPNALKIVFAKFSDREDFIDVLVECLLASDPEEEINDFIDRISILESNCNNFEWYVPNEKLYFTGHFPNKFWKCYPLTIIPKVNLHYYEKNPNCENEQLIAYSKLELWLKYHPGQRVYMFSLNKIYYEDCTEEEKKLLSKCETIEMYEDEE